MMIVQKTDPLINYNYAENCLFNNDDCAGDCSFNKYYCSEDCPFNSDTCAGDGKDEEVAAKTMNFPFWRINAHSDLIAFYNALDMGYM